MHVAFDETWQHALAPGVDDPRMLCPQARDLFGLADSEEAVGANRQGFGARRGGIHGQDSGIGDDEVSRGHDASSSKTEARNCPLEIPPASPHTRRGFNNRKEVIRCRVSSLL